MRLITFIRLLKADESLWRWAAFAASVGFTGTLLVGGVWALTVPV